MKPKLKLIISPKSDTRNAQSFVAYREQSQFVKWFLPTELQYLTDPKILRSKRNRIISAYTKKTFANNKQKIARGVGETKKRWAKMENKFYDLVNVIFRGHPWPKGNYTGYASIFYMFPRHIQEQTFFFPYSRKRLDPLCTIAHEMLHFIFFDYIKKNYGIKEQAEFKGQHPKYVWRVSETFNTVIENWSPFKKIFRAKKNCKPYPECAPMFNVMTKQWAKNQDIKILLDKWLLK